jgi:spore maturation protein CgeB
MSGGRRPLLVANLAPEHLGAHLLSGGRNSGIECATADMREAWAGPSWLRRFCHHALGRRPSALGAFSAHVLASCRAVPPSVLLSTGVAPLHASALRSIRTLGVRCVNFLTDDPWNPANGARFFWDALREYDRVYTPRTANLEDLRDHGCRDVRYLPFGYNPELHFPAETLSATEVQRYACDVAFIGAADDDRVRLLEPLLRSELHVRLYGSYWSRRAKARAFDGGMVHDRELRAAVAGAKVHVCMGRAANRDGHAMRSFELPAMRACMIVEDTLEHRELFGEDGACVVYYRGATELIARARELCADDARRERLSRAAWQRITTGEHTYAARLRALIRA